MLTVEHLEFKIVDDRDGLVVAADVLANSLAYLLRPGHLKNNLRLLTHRRLFSAIR
jgi:hypothetical protein